MTEEMGKSLYQLANQRRSTRLFQDRPVPQDVLKRVVSAALDAPSSCNRQLWHFIAVTDKTQKDRMSHLGDQYMQSYFYDAPVILAVFYDTTVESRNPCYTPYVTMGMAIYGILLAAKAEGLGSIYLGGINNPRGIEEALGVPDYMTNLGLICLGYQEDDPPTPEHRSVEDIFSVNLWDKKEKRLHHDIRPALWSLEQLADFRDKVLWYKGIAFDASTLHVNPEIRFSRQTQFMTERLGMLLAQYNQPEMLDVMPFNGDLLLQIFNTYGEGVSQFYAYDLTPGIGHFIEESFKGLFPTEKFAYLCNESMENLRIPMEDGQVDVVSCYERLGQFDDPMPLLQEIYRILRPGGKVLVTVSNRYYPHMYWYKRILKKNYSLGRNWNFGPERKMSFWHCRRLFEEAGFRMTASWGLQPLSAALWMRVERFCRGRQWHEQGDRLAEKRGWRYVSQGFQARFSRSLVFELEKE